MQSLGELLGRLWPLLVWPRVAREHEAPLLFPPRLALGKSSTVQRIDRPHRRRPFQLVHKPEHPSTPRIRSDLPRDATASASHGRTSCNTSSSTLTLFASLQPTSSTAALQLNDNHRFNPKPPEVNKQPPGCPPNRQQQTRVKQDGWNRRRRSAKGEGEGNGAEARQQG
mmetsp:Transcript_48606/g.75879  ORF Transcript_48606/g.75879 Transcript_48606/m.75879 type:complete len:169 (-) Transcript_48606:50-556(-)